MKTADDSPVFSGDLRVQRITGEALEGALRRMAIEVDSAFHAVFGVFAEGDLLAAMYIESRSLFQASCSPPHIFDDAATRMCTPLMDASCTLIDRRNVAITTMLTDQLSEPVLQAVETVGFRHASDVSFHLCHPHRFSEVTCSPLELSPVDDLEGFVQLIQATCEDSQDLPVMLSSWSAREMLVHQVGLEGHQGDLWFVASHQGKEVGVLIVEADAVECRLVYMGIVPEFRGRGWGELLVKQAMRIASERQVQRLVLCVDTNNEPANDVYQRVGFVRYATQRLYYRRNRSRR